MEYGIEYMTQGSISKTFRIQVCIQLLVALLSDMSQFFFSLEHYANCSVMARYVPSSAA
jgi:hypothetical protein